MDVALGRFCGSQFWNTNLTWNTDNPSFTPCFEKTVLVWIPCLFLVVFSSIDIFLTSKSKIGDIPWNWRNLSKIGLCGILTGICVFDLIYNLKKSIDGKSVYPVDTYTPFFKIIAVLLVVGLIFFHRKKGVRSSGVLFLFWFLFVLLGIPQLKSSIDNINFDDYDGTNISFILFFGVCGIILILNFLSDLPPSNADYSSVDNPCPESGASFPSKLTFSWFDKLAYLGYKQPLTPTDLWSLNNQDRAAEITPLFDKYWFKSVESNANKSAAPIKAASFDKNTASVDLNTIEKFRPKPSSILPALCKAFGPSFVLYASLKLCQDLLGFVSPQILELLISFIQGDEPTWRGYLYACMLFFTAFLQTIFLSQYFNKMMLIGLRIRTALISAIYRKALKLSSSARKESTVGEIVNLMSVDAQRFMDLTTYLNMIWSAPLQIALAIYFLWLKLGPSVLAGLAVMVIMIPVNGWIANRVKTLQIKQMKNKDDRVKLMNEILSGIKVLKLYAWEPSFEQQILKIREKEVKILKTAAYFNAATSFIWSCAPFLVSSITFATYVLSDESHVLDASKAFVTLALFNVMRVPMTLLPLVIASCAEVSLVTFAVYVMVDERNILDAKTAFVSLSLFNLLRFPLSMLPMMISNVIQTSVSVKRINKFMNSEELDPSSVNHNEKEEDALVMEHCTFKWSAEDAPILMNINLRIKHKSLVAVVGAVGSGKSSLLSAFLGEMEKTLGYVNTKGSVAYVPQLAWIQNATLQENILFGRALNKKKYSKVIEACALKQDLDMLPGGDQTEIGEKGINLSGGQKQRVSLARAVYCDSDIYYLDDPLSAVDSHVGKHIFESVIGPKGMLHDKTRVFVTHGITYLPHVDLIVVLKDGSISEIGTYTELLDKKGAFAEFLTTHLQEVGKEELDEIDDELKKQLIDEIPGLERQITRQRSVGSESSETNSLTRRHSSISNKSVNDLLIKKKEQDNKLTEDEKAEVGGVKWEVYSHYLKSIGPLLATATVVFNVIYQGFSVGSNVWLSVWSSDTKMVVNGTLDTGKRDMYLEVYGLLGFGQSVASFLADLVPRIGCLRAAYHLHNLLVNGILRAPLSFTDVTPSGRIISRSSKGVDALDNQLPWDISDSIYCFFEVVGTFVVISYSTPSFIFVILPIGCVYYCIQRFFVATSRQLKRLESISRSPIYSHFGETVTGSSVIRAYNVNNRFIKESEERVDTNQACAFPGIIANRWLAVRLEMVGNCIIFFSALFAVIGRETMTAGLVGLSVSYALQITQTLNWLVRMSAEVETNIVAVERIKEYGETPQEAPWEKTPNIVGPNWPEEGKVEFKDFKVRYREGLELVLKGINFSIKGGEKVGIVGRTGAGKSSLTLGLFRIIEAAGGSILIDGVDLSKLGLHVVRSRITIIPQDPVLFSGTLRMNLDPFETYTDDQVWRALELAHLKNYVSGLPAKLQHIVSEGGDNLSVGQRQLICLARALLRKTKVLVLDEATAAVDLETDDLIQRTIRTEFAACTVLTIAHRINTIMDSDRVLVLSKGLVVEFEAPDILLRNKTSAFYSMAKDAGLVN